MDRLKLRGVKRRCQNEGCALPFYDLNRSAFACPNCGTNFVEQAAPAPATRSGWRSFGGAGSMRRDRAPIELVADVVKSEEAVEGVEEPSFDNDGDAAPLLETEDEEDAVAIEPAPDETSDS